MIYQTRRGIQSDDADAEWLTASRMLSPDEAAQAALDRLLYGTSFVSVVDGKAERVDPWKVVVRPDGTLEVIED